MTVQELINELMVYCPKTKVGMITNNNDILDIKCVRYLVDNEEIICCVSNKEKEVG